MCGVHQNNKSKIIYSESEIINLYNSNNICLYIYMYIVFISLRDYIVMIAPHILQKSHLWEWKLMKANVCLTN